MFKDGTSDTFERDTTYFREILCMSGLDLWEYDHVAGLIAWCSMACALLSRAGSTPPDSLAAGSAWVHPEDLPRLRAGVRGRVLKRAAEGQPLRAAGAPACIDRQRRSDRGRASEGGEHAHPALHGRAGAWGRSIPARRMRRNTREYERAVGAADGRQACCAGSLAPPHAQAARMAEGAAYDAYESRASAVQGRTFFNLQKGAQAKMTSTDDRASVCPGSEAHRPCAHPLHNPADQAPALIWMAGPDLGRYYFNQAWLDFTGRTLAEEQGDGWMESVHPDDLGRCLETYQAAFAAQLPFSKEYRLRRHDGEYRWITSKGAPSYDSQGQFLGYIGSGLDITELKHAEEALKNADRHKDEFLAILAHELRNPLAPLRNALHVLGLGEGGDAQGICAMMQRQVGHLARLVDDLLEMSRIARGKVELKPEPVDLTTVLGSAIETSQPLIESARHRLHVAWPEQPLGLHADPARLTQVFVNLLNNAAKYMAPGGEIRVDARRHDGHAVVSIRDQGIGISPDRLAHVFDLFVQGEDGTQGGLGVGLCLVRDLVQMHGGQVEAYSDGPGRGSEFVVYLPLAVPQAEAPSAPVAPPCVLPSAPRRVLVVDDNHDSADSLGLLLGYLGAEARVAYSGQAALDMVADGFAPGLVLLDLGMPGMDGYEVARRLRQLPDGAAPTVVALTGWGQDRDKHRTQVAGFDLHMVKPVDAEDLKRLLQA